MITGGVQDAGKVAQVIDYLDDRSMYAIMLNHNGAVRYEKQEFLRKATPEEKKKDKKLHSRELQLDQYEQTWLNEHGAQEDLPVAAGLVEACWAESSLSPTLKEWDNDYMVDDDFFLYDQKDRTKKIGKVVGLDNPDGRYDPDVDGDWDLEFFDE